jgi:hypothetical protein
VLADEESMTELCARFGISRKTGYKLLHRYREKNAAGLLERSRAPHITPWAITEAQGRGDSGSAPGASELGAEEAACEVA